MCSICCFPLAAFNICSLCLIFINLINMCLRMFHLGFILFGTLWVSWTWVAISFPILGKFSIIISSGIFSWSFLLSSSSETPMILMLGSLILSQRSFLVAQRLKSLPGIQETRVQSLGWEDSLEKEMATHSSTLAWRIPWREEPGRLQSMGSQRVGHD